MKLTIENLKSCLSRIDYEIKGEVPNRFIYDHTGKNTGARVWNETIDFGSSKIKSVAVINKCKIKMMRKDTVMIGDEKFFILFHNFNKK